MVIAVFILSRLFLTTLSYFQKHSQNLKQKWLTKVVDQSGSQSPKWFTKVVHQTASLVNRLTNVVNCIITFMDIGPNRSP